MKALTIQQPWAGLIAAGVKTIENRTWTTHYRGLIAIHAGAKWHRRGAAEQAQHADRLAEVPGCLSMGRIVAVATLCNVLHYADLPDEAARDPFAEGPFCWILADVRPLAESVQPFVRGALGLWALSDEQATIVIAATRVTPSSAPGRALASASPDASR